MRVVVLGFRGLRLKVGGFIMTSQKKKCHYCQFNFDAHFH